MNGRHGGRCCCLFTCLSASAGFSILFLGVFLVLLGLLQSSDHHALRLSGWVLLGSGSGLLILAGVGLLCPAGRSELYDCCLQASRQSQVGAASAASDCESVSSGDSYYEPPPQLRVIPPTPYPANENSHRPGTAPEFVISR